MFSESDRKVCICTRSLITWNGEEILLTAQISTKAKNYKNSGDYKIKQKNAAVNYNSNYKTKMRSAWITDQIYETTVYPKTWERVRERTRQSRMLYKVWLARCYLVVKDHNASDSNRHCIFEAMSNAQEHNGFQVFVWISSIEHVVNLSNDCNRYKYPLWAKYHAIPLILVKRAVILLRMIVVVWKWLLLLFKNGCVKRLRHVAIYKKWDRRKTTKI